MECQELSATMPKRKDPELNPEEQFKRFKEAAKKAGVTDKEEEFERAFKKVVPATLERLRLLLRLEASQDPRNAIQRFVLEQDKVLVIAKDIGEGHERITAAHC